MSVYTGSGLYALNRVVDNNDHAYCPSDSWGSKVTFDAQAGTTNLIATFPEKMDIASITESTFKLFKVTSSRTTQITNVTVSPSTGGLKATLDPFGTSTTLLAKNTKYKAAITTGAKDVADN